MYSLGIDIGSSSVKASLLHVETGQVKASAQSPDSEMAIEARKTGYAEQSPEMWWKEVIAAVRKTLSGAGIGADDIKCIGITYQMHGLVMTDATGEVIRPSIIWCDSRAVEQGERMASVLGPQKCLERLLNLPGNFTASKLAWVRENETGSYGRCSKIMLPGDWIVYKITGEISTTMTGLSEGTLWDFKENKIADFLLKGMELREDILPQVVPSFGEQGRVTEKAASELGLRAGTPVSYRAGDQPNNAFSLNVLKPGEVAATAGTSGVVYAVTDRFRAEDAQGINAFAHVNHTLLQARLGILLCINGTGIANSWMRKLAGGLSYEEMNLEAAQVAPGSEGLSFLPFGNGAERMLGNEVPGASVSGINFNLHGQKHLFRAVQEGIAFAFYYGMKKLLKAGVEIHTLKAGKANLFQSPVFTSTLATIAGSKIILYNTDGAAGAARGAALGAGYYHSTEECFSGLNVIGEVLPEPSWKNACEEACGRWENRLIQSLKSTRS